MPVKEFINDIFPASQQDKIFEKFAQLECRDFSDLALGGHLKKLTGKDSLYEIRLSIGVEYRFFCKISGPVCLLVHAFVKKSTKTPMKEIRTALNRLS